MATVWQSVLALDGRVQSQSRSHCVRLELLCLVVMDPPVVSGDSIVFIVYMGG